MESKKEILEIINNSRLETTQKSIWEIFLEVSTEKQIGAIVELLKIDPEQIYFLTQNIQDKFWAMKTMNRKSMQGIMAQEREYILGK